MKHGVDQLVLIARALSDPNRVTALAALRHGELCLCQIIDLLGLAPSTASRHMTVLGQAGLVSVRRDGRFHYYREADGDNVRPIARAAIELIGHAVSDDENGGIDQTRLRDVLSADLQELAGCYRPNGARQARVKATV